jgi:hypothetical protein
MKNKLIYWKEEDFREAIIKPWLRKKGFKILTQHGHGVDEHGKDIMIKDSFGKIGACVVKPKIHGQYSKEGNLEEIRNQISAALNVPFPDYKEKNRKKVDFIFVVSENKITPTAKESIIESFKKFNKVTFFSGEDILEEYYALPLKLRSISIHVYFCPKSIDDIKKIENVYKEFEMNVECSGDKNSFGVFNRTLNCGKVKEVTLSKTLENVTDIRGIDLVSLLSNIKDFSKNKIFSSVFIYFEEDNLEKVENFFNHYIANDFKEPNLDVSSGKIAVYFEEENTIKFKKLVSLLEKWM